MLDIQYVKLLIRKKIYIYILNIASRINCIEIPSGIAISRGGIAIFPGSAEDPKGLPHAELMRLFEAALPIGDMDASFLSPEGRKTGVKARAQEGINSNGSIINIIYIYIYIHRYNMLFDIFVINVSLYVKYST